MIAISNGVGPLGWKSWGGGGAGRCNFPRDSCKFPTV